MISFDLHNKNALVCGASKGIGKACAELLARAGANVTVLARNEESLVNLIGQLPKAPHQHHSYLVADMSKPDELDKRLQTFGMDHHIHILVTNTGGPPGGKASTAHPQEYLTAFQQHLISNQILVLRLKEGMRKEGYGRIINIISTSVKQPLEDLGVSNTVRGAVANWAKTLANEFAADGITVNNVLPGATLTERLQSIIEHQANSKKKTEEEIINKMIKQIPAGRFGIPEEIASAVLFLASPLASYINGINLPVDGGRTKSL